MQTKLSLRYSGPSVESGKMDVYDAAANMIAFSEFAVAAAKATYGENINARAEVAGFGKGSFITDLIINLGGPLTNLFVHVTTKDILETIKEAVLLWKFLKGSPPVEVEGSGDQITITNNNGQVNYFNAHTVNLVFDESATDAVGRFIRAPLDKGGVDSVDVTADSDDGPMKLMTINQDEAKCFVPVAIETPLFDQTIQAALMIEAPVFKDGNKWRFNDGANSFHASIEDESFIHRVNEGEPFAKGDILMVDLRIQQKRQGERLVTEKSVIRVIEHRRRRLGDQQSLV